MERIEYEEEITPERRRIRITIIRDTPAPVITSSIHLSPQEKLVLGFLADGLTIPAIANKLFISISTAKVYVTRLYEKLNVHSRAAAIMCGVSAGLLTPPELEKE